MKKRFPSSNNTYQATVFKTRAGYAAGAFSKKGLMCFVLPRKTKTLAVRELKRKMPVSFSLKNKKLTDFENKVKNYFIPLKIHNSKSKIPKVPLDFSLCSEFEKKVLKTLVHVAPFGKTVSYSELAALAKCPKASRAVGNALSQNPLPLFVPCHRVLRKNGAIGGFTGGMKLKKKLLRLEGIYH